MILVLGIAAGSALRKGLIKVNAGKQSFSQGQDFTITRRLVLLQWKWSRNR